MIFFRKLYIAFLATAATAAPKAVEAAIREVDAVIGGLQRAETRLQTLVNHEVEVIDASYTRQEKLLQKERDLRSAAFERQDNLLTAINRAARIRQRIADLLA